MARARVVLRPPVDRDEAVARVDRDHHDARVLAREIEDHRRVSHGRRAQHDARRTRLEHGLEVGAGPHPSADLHPRTERRGDRSHRLELRRPSRPCPRQIDHVDNRHLAAPLPRARGRIGVVHGDVLVAALQQAHCLALEQVDRRQDVHDDRNLPSSARPLAGALLGVELAREDAAPRHGAHERPAIVGGGGDDGRVLGHHDVAVHEVEVTGGAGREQARVAGAGLGGVPAHVRDLERRPGRGIGAALQPRDVAADDPQPRRARRLLARLEEDLQAQADAQVRPPRPQVLLHRLAQRPRQRPRAVPEGALTGHHQPVRRTDADRISRHVHLHGNARAARRFQQRALDAPQVAQPGVADRDAHPGLVPPPRLAGPGCRQARKFGAFFRGAERGIPGALDRSGAVRRAKKRGCGAGRGGANLVLRRMNDDDSQNHATGFVADCVRGARPLRSSPTAALCPSCLAASPAWLAAPT